MPMIDLPPGALDELRALYRSLDGEVASLDCSCARCGACCDFSRSGLSLYMGPVEAALFFQRAPASHTTNAEICQFFINRACTNRDARSIGCRTYFCSSPLRDTLQDLHEKYLALSRHLCERLHIPWRYQPLSRWTHEYSITSEDCNPNAAKRLW